MSWVTAVYLSIECLKEMVIFLDGFIAWRSSSAGVFPEERVVASNPSGGPSWGRLGAIWVKPKTDQMYPKFVPKSVPGGVPEGSQRGPGVVLEGSPSQVGSESSPGPLLGPL